MDTLMRDREPLHQRSTLGYILVSIFVAFVTVVFVSPLGRFLTEQNVKDHGSRDSTADAHPQPAVPAQQHSDTDAVQEDAEPQPKLRKPLAAIPKQFLLLDGTSNWSDNWHVPPYRGYREIGKIHTVYSSSLLQVLTQSSGKSGWISQTQLFSQRTFSGNFEAIVELKQAGDGGTGVWLASEDLGSYGYIAEIRSFDLNRRFLSFSRPVGGFQGYTEDATPYVDQWTTIRLAASSGNVSLYVNDILKTTTDLPPKAYNLVLTSNVGQGDYASNESLFRFVEVRAP